MNKVDFSKMSNSEINLKMKGYEDEFNAIKTNILGLVSRLNQLDDLYKQGRAEINKRGALSDE